MAKQRDDGGKYTESVTDGDLLHFFASEQRDFYSAGEVAEEFDLDRSQAHRRLSDLADEGELERVRVGNRNVVWWRPRDVVVLVEDEGGFSALEPETGVASQGDTRPEALRMLAEALELHSGAESELSREEMYEELGMDPGEIDDTSKPPWE